MENIDLWKHILCFILHIDGCVFTDSFFLLRSSIYTRIGYKPYLFPYYLFCGDFPLLFTVKGGIRYIEISIMFFCGLLFITLPVFPFLSDGNILFALFDIICFIGSYIYGSSGVISAIITYILCMWIITGAIYLLQRKIHNGIWCISY